ncbi:hypothetical protein [Cupriavidus necator]|uniref:hypothetical protein n=1 Tax=Cupriavidus necator TaxID=106590 RepID=UPI0039C47886
MPTSLFRQACNALATLTTLAVCGGLNVPAHAQATDSKPVRLIVPTQPGSQADAVARALSQSLGKNLGQSVVVENIAGAGGVPGHPANRQGAERRVDPGIDLVEPRHQPVHLQEPAL